MSAVDAIPSDYPCVSPYLQIDGASEAIDFYTQVLGATERLRMPADTPDRIGHAELQLGNSLIMLADEYPEMELRGPHALGGSPVTIHVYVEDVDAVFARALQAGARSLQDPQDQFYGDRSGQFEDPFGHRWNIASHTEDVSEKEMARRMAELSTH